MPIAPVTAQVPIAPVNVPAIEPVAKTETDNKSSGQDAQSDSQSRKNDNVVLSALGRQAQQASEDEENGVEADDNKPGQQQLSDEQRLEVQQLANRDREVRAHEAAHKAVAGSYAKGSASFTYKDGPDGRRYAVGGEVSINAGKPSDPAEALKKAETIRRAALAPAQPSGQDRAIAAQATTDAAQARTDIQAKEAQERLELEQKRAQSSAQRRQETEQRRDARTEAARAYESDPTSAGPELEVTA